MADASGLGGIKACFGHRNFRIYFAGNATSLVGTWMQRVAAGWLAWELTHSPTWLGIVAMADFFPTIFLGPLGGALADRYSRVTIMIITQVFAAIASAALCAASETETSCFPSGAAQADSRRAARKGAARRGRAIFMGVSFP
mgnify:CR=1 FL=1